MSRTDAHLANLDLNLLVALREFTLVMADYTDLEALWWHRQYEDDIAHAWLRRLIVEACRRL